MSLFSRTRSNLPVQPSPKFFKVIIKVAYRDYSTSWFWEFEGDSAEEDAKKRYSEICSIINNTKDGEFVSVSEDLLLRRDSIVEVYYS